MQVGGREVSIETGKYAEQTNGSCLVRWGLDRKRLSCNHNVVKKPFREQRTKGSVNKSCGN